MGACSGSPDALRPGGRRTSRPDPAKRGSPGPHGHGTLLPSHGLAASVGTTIPIATFSLPGRNSCSLNCTSLVGEHDPSGQREANSDANPHGGSGIMGLDGGWRADPIPSAHFGRRPSHQTVSASRACRVAERGDNRHETSPHGSARAGGHGTGDAGGRDHAPPRGNAPGRHTCTGCGYGACRDLPVMPPPRDARWLQAPATTQVEVLSPYGVGQTITYRSSSGAGLTVWQQHNWTLGLWTSIGPSALSAESVFAPLRLPGRGGLLWPQGEPLRMAWCTRRGNYTVSVAGLPPAAPLAAAVIRAWSDAPAGVYRCRTTTQAIVCTPPGSSPRPNGP